MEQYIKKSDLVTEIEKRIKEIDEIGTYLSPKGVLTNLLCHLNTLEVKEVDFESGWKKYFEYRGDLATVNIKHLAKHFYELGLKVKKGE